MKSFVAYLLLFALLGSAMCGRRRRQAPSAAAGAPGGITTPGTPTNKKAGMGIMTNDLFNQQSFGVPVNPNAVGKVAGTGIVAMEDALSISNPSKDNVDQLKTAPALAADEASDGAPPA